MIIAAFAVALEAQIVPAFIRFNKSTWPRIYATDNSLNKTLTGAWEV